MAKVLRDMRITRQAVTALRTCAICERSLLVGERSVRYSADGEHWTEVPKTPWAPRHAASLYVHDDALWMVAGNNMQSDVWKLKRK